jgi:oligopeptide transport system substrate-binding protein
LVIPFFFTGCAHKEEELTNLQKITVIETEEPPSLDSAKSHDLTSFKILKNIMEGLTRRGEHNKLTLGMADALPDISKDKRTYLFHLRKAKWSDGKRVTAYDFEYAWKRVL